LAFEQSGEFALPERLVADRSHTRIVLHQRADEYRRQRNFTLAIDAYQRATGYNPANASAYFGLGESYFWMQDYQAAADAFVEATRLGYRPSGLAYKGLGHSLYNLGYYDQAAKAFEESIAGLGADRAANAVHLADAYIGLGRCRLRWATAPLPPPVPGGGDARRTPSSRRMPTWDCRTARIEI
jgi:tetratricopeptide (TPR) repeat protein